MNASNPSVEFSLRPLAIGMVLVREAGLATVADGMPSAGAV